ncbi:hypothetical protein [Pseudidiomarina aestuarii]|uniref:hypothetical protein n=1 Tax=Pseudidiomarina aestuarii TaxID=624146 RepID=UPI003A9752B4
MEITTIIRFILGLAVIFNVSVSNAAAVQPIVTWAGVGFSGDWASRMETYPITSGFFCGDTTCNDDNSIEVWAREHILRSEKLPNYSFDLRAGFVDEDSVDQIGIAIAIANESVAIEELSIDGKPSYLTNYVISGSSLFFDIASSKLIFSVPLITRYTTVYQSLPDTDTQRNVFKNLLQNKTLGINFFDQMSLRLSEVDFQAKPTAYLQITNASFSGDSKAKLSSDINLAGTERYLATYFENVFVKETGYALIPNSVGHAIGNKIATRIPSGDLTIELPEPGYTMEFSVAKLLFQRKPGRGTDSFCWGARIEWRLYELVFGEEMIGTSDLKNVNCAVIGHDSVLSHDSEYIKLIMGILEQYAKQFKKQEADWINRHAEDPRQTRAALSKLNDIFAQ